MPQFIEVAHFGWNLLTISALGTLALTGVSALGLIHQYRTIRDTRSGKAVSVANMIILTMFLVGVLIYGIYINSLVSIITSVVRVPITLLILARLREYRGFSFADMQCITGACTLIVALIALPYRDFMFTLIALVGMGAAALPSLAMLRARSVGSVSLPLFWTYFLITLFWALYGAAAHNGFICATSSVSCILNTFTLVVAYYYRRLAPSS